MFELLVIVDPDHEILSTFGRFFKMQGYCVATAANGLEAMRHLRLQRPDLIIIEPALMDGWGERVWEQYRNSAEGVPVIGVSQRSHSNIPFPFSEYYVKPVSLERLLATIRASLLLAS